MTGNWLRIGNLLLNQDWIVAVRLSATWATSLNEETTSDVKYAANETKSGVEIVLNVDFVTLRMHQILGHNIDDLLVDPSYDYSQGWSNPSLARLRFADGSDEAKLLREHFAPGEFDEPST